MGIPTAQNNLFTKFQIYYYKTKVMSRRLQFLKDIKLKCAKAGFFTDFFTLETEVQKCLSESQYSEKNIWLCFLYVTFTKR